MECVYDVCVIYIKNMCMYIIHTYPINILGSPRGSDGKESACNAGDLGSIPG